MLTKEQYTDAMKKVVRSAPEDLRQFIGYSHYNDYAEVVAADTRVAADVAAAILDEGAAFTTAGGLTICRVCGCHYGGCVCDGRDYLSNRLAERGWNHITFTRHSDGPSMYNFVGTFNGVVHHHKFNMIHDHH